MSQLGYYICMPFAWLTRIFYTLTGSYGVALILFTLVVNGLVLFLVAAVTPLEVAGFGAALVGALVLSLVSLVLSWALKD